MHHCLVYLSSSTDLLSQDELARLLHKSQRNNQASGISGLLVCCEGSIIQVLEGNEDKVKALYQLISRDPRHKRLIKLYDQPVEERLFTNWPMAYKTGSAKSFGCVDELLFSYQKASLSKENERVLMLVRCFYESNMRLGFAK